MDHRGGNNNNIFQSYSNRQRGVSIEFPQQLDVLTTCEQTLGPYIILFYIYIHSILICTFTSIWCGGVHMAFLEGSGVYAISNRGVGGRDDIMCC